MPDPMNIPVPARACDTHLHVIGPAGRSHLVRPVDDGLFDATWVKYRQEACAAGLARAVIVQPSFYGTDNRLTLETSSAEHVDTRSIVVIDPAAGRHEMKALHAAGARGVRFNLFSGGLDVDDLEAVAGLVRDLGWHIQLFMDASAIPALAARLIALNIDIVFDHMAHTSRDESTESAGFQALLSLLQTGRCWVKLSNAIFPPSSLRARALVRENPERLVWGSDWPHVIYEEEPLGLGSMLRDLWQWTGTSEVFRKVLVENPDRLYFFQ